MKRLGVLRLLANARPSLGEDARRLPILVAAFFGLGLLEAGLLLLIVQMAVALAAERETFDIALGPMAVHDITIRAGVVAGLGLVALLVIVLVPTSMLGGSIASQALLRTRRRVAHAYLRASWTARSTYPEGHLQELLTIFSARTEHAVTQLITAATAACGLVAVLAVAIAASPVVAMAALLCVGAAGAALRPLMRRSRSTSSTQATAGREFAGRMAEVSRVAPEITVFDVARPVEDLIAAQAGHVSMLIRRLRILSRLVASLYQYAAFGLVVAAIGVLVVVTDGEGLATMGTVLLLLVRALTYGQNIQSQIQSSNEIAPFVERIETEIDELTAAEVDRSGAWIDRPTSLRFDGVWFAYEPGHDVLRDIDFSIETGESIGIVGRSGAGKSTLVQLLLRLRDPSRGRIVVDGLPFPEVSLERWYQLVAYVPQDNQLIRGTVADNIRFFRPGIDLDQVQAAATQAHLHDDIVDLPQGYDTPLGQGIRQLSGGQRQRLGIARALVGNPQMIILDEPTSALDARSEALVTETLASLHGVVTVVIIAHRPATTAICDHIIRLTDGRASTEALDDS